MITWVGLGVVVVVDVGELFLFYCAVGQFPTTRRRRSRRCIAQHYRRALHFGFIPGERRLDGNECA